MKKSLLSILLSAFIYVNVVAQCANVTAPYFNYWADGGGHYSFVDISANRTAGQANQVTGTQSYEWWYTTGGGPNIYFGAYIAADHTFVPGVTYNVCEQYTDYLLGGGVCTYGPYCANVTVPNACPTINYNITSVYSTDGATYTFTDACTGLPPNPFYTWKIDGVPVGSGSHINHTFTTSGTHQVCEAIGAGGCTYGPFCYDVHVQICNGFPDFSTSGNAPTYTFTNTSTGMTSPVFQWKFDGTNGCTTTSCQHTFSNGHHTLGLYITDGNCTYSATNTYDQGTGGGGCPTLSGGFNSSSIDGINYAFTNTTTGLDGNATYSWSIDAVHQSGNLDHYNETFTTPGYHSVCFTINDYGCDYTACDDSVLACTIPDGGMSFNETHAPTLLIADSLVNTLPIKSHSWSIDGVLCSHDSIFSHTFVSGNTYHICDDFVLANGCSFLNCEDHLIPQASGINKIKSVAEVQLFPNPSASGMVTISIPNKNASKIEVFNNMGQEVFEQVVPKTELVPLDLSALSNGTYIVRVKTNEGAGNIRWLKM